MDGVLPAGEAQVCDAVTHLGERTGAVLHTHLGTGFKHVRADVALAKLYDGVRANTRHDFARLRHRLRNGRHQVADVAFAHPFRNVRQLAVVEVKPPGIDKVQFEAIDLPVPHRCSEALMEELAPIGKARIPHIRPPRTAIENLPGVVAEIRNGFVHKRNWIPQDYLRSRIVKPRHMCREVLGVSRLWQVLAHVGQFAKRRRLPAVVHDDRVKPNRTRNLRLALDDGVRDSVMIGAP